jgi:hypothetical protein
MPILTLCERMQASEVLKKATEERILEHESNVTKQVNQITEVLKSQIRTNEEKMQLVIA